MTEFDRVKPPRWTDHKVIGAGRWNPWQTLAQDCPGWTVRADRELPDNILGLTSFTAREIWLCKTLTRRERDCTLAHELVHVERGRPPTDDRAAALAEERIVDEITARRMIPFRDLAHVMVTRCDADLYQMSVLLHVDLPTLKTRILTLTPTERSSLTMVRGGPIHVVPHFPLWDCTDHETRARELQAVTV